MSLLGIILVAPAWGVLSTRLFLQSCVAAVGLIINLLGLTMGRVKRRNNAFGAMVAIFSVALWSSLLYFGYFLLSKILEFGYTTAENIVYWIFAVASLVYFGRQIPIKIRRTWSVATVPGALEMQIAQRKARKT